MHCTLHFRVPRMLSHQEKQSRGRRILDNTYYQLDLQKKNKSLLHCMAALHSRVIYQQNAIVHIRNLAI